MIHLAKYNFFIRYCKKDGLEYARQLTRLLIEKGYTVWTNENEFRAGTDFSSVISEAIINSDCFLPIITEQYNWSDWAKQELDFAMSLSESRAKKVLPVLFTENLSSSVHYYISKRQCIRVIDPLDMTEVAEQIDRIYGSEQRTAIQYEKLAEFKNIKNDDKKAVTLCKLIDMAVVKWKYLSKSNYKEMQNICKEICYLYIELESYSGRYDDESRETAKLIVATLDKVESLLSDIYEYPSDKDLFDGKFFFSAFAIRILYSECAIRQECADILSYGNVHSQYPIEMYISKQTPFVKIYTDLSETPEIEDGLMNCPDEDISFLKDAKDFIFEAIHDKEIRTFSPKSKDNSEPAESDDILLSVAKFMQESYKLFDLLQSQGVAGDFLNCLLTSYERLKSYCEIVGAKNIAADCVDRIVEIRNAIEYPSNNAKFNEKAENGIKSLLGFTLKGNGDYDVFISYKSEDSDLAERIYNFCQQKLRVPFWSKRTLPQLSKSEYEDAIYDALRKARHFVIVLSKLEYLDSNWVKKEMATFDRAITEGRKQNANFVFIVTDDVYKEIMESNKMCLNERYCGYQIIKMSEFEKTLLSYIV